MKKIFLVAALAVFTSSAFAQLLTGKSASLAREEPSANWSTLYWQYNPVSFSADGNSHSVDGLSMGFNWNKSLSANLPLFLEFGIGGQICLSDKEIKDFVMVSAKVPIGVNYVFNIPNTPIDLIPSAGLDFRVNLHGQYKGFNYKKMEYDDVDVFSKDEMGDSDHTWNRVQVGFHIGGYVRFWHKLLLGATYQFDFNEIAKDTKMNQANLTLGICF